MDAHDHAKMSAPRAIGLRLGMLGMLAMLALPARAAELLVFERPGCVWCLHFDREVAPIYPKTEEGRLAPIRRIDIDQGDTSGLVLATPVRLAPTFVLVEDGREVGRILGYAGEDAMWGLLADLTKKLSRTP